MEFKQGVEGYRTNVGEATKQLLPAILKNTMKNGQRVSDWLVEHCSEGDIVDASTRNILRAIRALDGAPLGVEWEVAPKPQKKRPDFLQTNDGSRQKQKDAESELDIQMRQERERRVALGNAANAELMSEAAAIVRNHSSISHSRTSRERAALKSEFDKLIAARVHPKKVLEGVLAWIIHDFTSEKRKGALKD
jgi:hypothetical protein